MHQTRMPHDLKLLVLLLLFAAWASKVPYGQVADLITGLFPWPEEQRFKWPSLLVVRAFIEITICLPAAFVAAKVFRRSMHVACLLVCLYIPRAMLDLTLPLTASYTNLFALYAVVIHALLLVGGVAAFSRQRPNGKLVNDVAQ